MVNSYTPKSDAEAFAIMNFSKQFNETQKQTERDTGPQVTAKVHGTVSRTTFSNGKMTSEKVASHKQADVTAPDSELPLDLFIRGLKWGNMPWLYEGIEYAQADQSP